ncbi:hypothetical protein F2Q70_00040395 [Brassica cretica]|uniref:Uncharacterized protein n=1 Tax=Brassica cretica TaxID=69181 RepID=A0A8S9KCS5_BRACR|nr:hypothetical protein F2Q70_00040395 [Brassica cretica]
MEFLETFGCNWSPKEVFKVIIGRAPYRSDQSGAIPSSHSDLPIRATLPERQGRVARVCDHPETRERVRSDLSQRHSEVAPEARSDYSERRAEIARVLITRKQEFGDSKITVFQLSPEAPAPVSWRSNYYFRLSVRAQSESSQVTSTVSDQPTKCPPGVKAAKGAFGKRSIAVDQAASEFQTIWSIKEKHMATKERLKKMGLLESLISKKEPLSEYEEELKKKLISEMLDMKRVSRDVCKWTQDATFSHKSMHKKSQVLLLSVEEQSRVCLFVSRAVFFLKS